MNKFFTIYTAAILALCLVAVSTAETYVFQNGLNGYSGTRDALIGPSTWGSVGASPTVTLEGVPNPNAGDKPGFIGFDNIFGTGAGQINPSLTITSAKLKVYVTSSFGGGFVLLDPMLKPWVEGTSTGWAFEEGVSTMDRRYYRASGSYATGDCWGTDGAVHHGPVSNVDYIDYWGGHPQSSLATYAYFPTNGTWMEIDVTNVVKAWQNGTIANNGWYLYTSAYWNGLYFNSSEYTADPSLRPKLEITSGGPPIAKFNFDTVLGGRKRVPDLTGNNHDAVFWYMIAPPVHDDPFNIDSSLSAYVDSTNSGAVAYLDNASTINLNSRNQFTLECWFKPDAYYGSYAASTLIQLYADGGSSLEAIGMLDTGYVQAFVYSWGTYKSVTSTTQLSFNTWYHIACTYGADGKLRLYIDGVEEGSTSVGWAMPASHGQVVIGGGGNFGATKGWIDDVAIYDYAKWTGAFTNPASFTPGTVYADAYGYNATDATDALQNAINSGASTVIVRNMGSPWYVSKPIEVGYRSHMNIQFENGVQIRDKDGAFWDNATYGMLFRVGGGDHQVWDGYGAEFKMRKSQYTSAPYLPSEFRFGMHLMGVQDITIRGLAIKDSGGDGISIEYGYEHYSSNVVLKDLLLDNHYRNGMSICSADNVTIDNVTISNTSGTAPQFGIDFEPYNPVPEQPPFMRLKDIVMKNCTFTNNHSGAVSFVITEYDTAVPISITVKDSTTTGGGVGVQWWADGKTGKGRTGSIAIDNVSITNPAWAGVWVYNKTSDPGIDLRFNKVAILASGSSYSPINLYGNSSTSPNCPIGNIRFDSVTITDNANRPFLNSNALAQTLGIKNVFGIFTVNNPFGPSWTLGSNLDNVTIRLSGDINGDGLINGTDLSAMLTAMDSKPSSGGTWNPNADLDFDGEVTSSDLASLLANMP